MASNEYVIRIPLTRSKKKTGPVSSTQLTDDTNETTEEKSYFSKYIAKSAESAQSAVHKIVRYGTAIAVADKLISYDISTVSLRTGATEYEQKLQFGYSMAKQTLLPAAIGLATGSLPGAIIGGLFSFAMQGITWAQNSQTIQYNKQLESISLRMANTRAGVTGSRSDKQ